MPENPSRAARRALDSGSGILRLAPAWVPRSFCIPGRRLKLHPDDYYAAGAERGGIDERWLSSAIPADNGPGTPEHEGLSWIVSEDGGRMEKILLRDAVEELKGGLIGERLWSEYGCWPIFSKFFDNREALPHHIHHGPEQAALAGRTGKPEAYYFPAQMNNYGGDFPYTFFGLRPGVSREEVLRALKNFGGGDNRITALSQAYRLEPGTGWDVPAGILHAPGSLCTYEPQSASDVFAMFESVTGGRAVPGELLWKDSPGGKKGDYDYLLGLIDWEANTDPYFYEKHFMAPVPVKDPAEMKAGGYSESWICYKSPAFSAKELTVFPGGSAVIKDSGAYGMILLEGRGKMGSWEIETPVLIRYGRITRDEFFVSLEAARAGVKITNGSPSEPLVMLKHFGPGNPGLEKRLVNA